MAIQYQHQLDKTFHALGDSTRREMLALLAQRGECTAGDLGEPFSISQPSVSKHLRVLQRAGLIERRIEGRTHRFRLIEKPFKEAQNWISDQRRFWNGALDSLAQVLDDM